MVKKTFILTILFFSLIFAKEDLANNQATIKNNIGIEVNPLRLILANENWFTFSGTLSYFDNQNGAEIAFPIFYSSDKYWNEFENRETRLNLDIHYRKFLFTKETNGLYIGGFGRYTYLDGEARDSSQYVTVNKFGLGIELGVRLKNTKTSSFYWGSSIAVGRYLGNSNEKLSRKDFLDVGWDDRASIFDIELLKVGYAF